VTALARPSVVRCVIFVGVALGALLSGASLAFAQSGGWSTPIPLSSAATTSWFPDVAADLSGKVHVVWSSGLSLGVGLSYDTVMYTSREAGSDWSNPLDIVALPSKGAVTRPTLLADPSGELNMTFRSYRLYYSRSPVQSVLARSLLTPIPISSGDNGYFSRLARDASDRLHVVYTEYSQTADCPVCLHVLYRVSADGGLSWSYPQDISRVPTGAAKPQIVVDGRQVLNVVWEAGRGGDLGQLSDPTTVMYSASDDGGMTWRAPIQLDTPGTSARNVALGLTGDDQLVVAWLGLPEDIVYFQTSGDHGLTWTPAQPIPGLVGGWGVYQARTDGYSMTTDSAGVVHLLVVGRTKPAQASLSVLHLAWDGSSWSAPEVIATLSGDVPEWPRASIGLGNRLHVVWFVRDHAHIWGGDGLFLYRVWYAEKDLDAPPMTPSVWPTPAVTSTGSTQLSDANATLTPSPDGPVPTIQMVASLDQAIPPADSENLALLAILQAMVPVFVLLAGVTVVAHRRRR
jgi:hypothetical protein